MRRVLGLTLVLALVLGAGACGDDEDGGDSAAATAESTAGGEAADERGAAGSEAETGASDELAAAEPAETQRCLKKAGFEVGSSTSTPAEIREATGSTAQLILVGGPDQSGAGGIVWYETVEQAIEANRAELEAQAPNSVVGRTGNAVYSYASSEALEQGKMAILECL